MEKRSTRIVSVEKGSLAEEIGLAPGDEILTANGHETPDELALKFHLSEEVVDLCIQRPNGDVKHLEVDLSASTHLGIKVEEFQTRTCSNACLFCFIDQLPAGIRPALLIKDDDYRLSFLHGNYITLTNLPDRELDRIIEQRLSPLYVSVHATDIELRTWVLGRKKADDLDRKIRKLIDGQIQLHTQIVLMPGINDGSNLEKTVFDLYSYFPGVQSVAVVPLGLSDHGTPRERFTPVTPGFCREIIEQAIPWQARFRSETGKTFVYLADEFYIQGGVDLPDASDYDEFSQIEDGIGMVRAFLDEFAKKLARRRKSLPLLHGTLVTGKLFYPTLRRCADRFNQKFGSDLRVCEVENRFLGKNITVAGLLGGEDIAAALANAGDIGDFVVIPNESISRVDGILVDNLAPADISERIQKPVYPSGRTMDDFFRLFSRQQKKR
jgi:putative radical SAM enzyme (TIGR03279 family)